MTPLPVSNGQGGDVMAVSRKKAWKVLIISLVILVLIAGGVWGCVAYRQAQEATAAAREHYFAVMRRQGYAVQAHLDCRVSVYSVRSGVEPWSFEGEVRDIVFVSDESAAVSYPSSVDPCWPGAETKKLVDGINEIIVENRLDLSQFGFPAGQSSIGLEDVFSRSQEIKNMVNSSVPVLITPGDDATCSLSIAIDRIPLT
jgi:hypothetical protein